jgi:hypothetical protein
MAATTNDAGEVVAKAVDWKIQMSLFLVPVVIYGAMLLGQKFPKSEAESAGTSLGEMLSTCFAPLMLVLLIIHAMVGYVELGTDSWISKITGAIMGKPAYGLALFVYTSLLMFALRFVAGPIVHRISPLGLLCASGVLGATGLTLLSGSSTVTMCIIAATIYACGKTFLWPTMLAVASEQFPKGGAVSIGMLGGVGMLSAGLLGGPAIGFKQDYNASANLQEVSKELARALDLVAKDGKEDKNLTALNSWWDSAKSFAEKDKEPTKSAGIYGGKMALKYTAYVPAIMAVLYLCLILYFQARGGYKAKSLDGEAASH